MTKLNLDFNRINLGHVLTIISMISTLFIFWINFESRISKVETNVEWLVKTMARSTSSTPPASNK